MVLDLLEAGALRGLIVRLLRSMKKETAIQLNELMLDFSKSLASTCAVVKEECPADEAKAFLKPSAHISALVFDLLDLIYLEHPDLKPPEFE